MVQMDMGRSRHGPVKKEWHIGDHATTLGTITVCEWERENRVIAASNIAPDIPTDHSRGDDQNNTMTSGELPLCRSSFLECVDWKVHESQKDAKSFMNPRIFFLRMIGHFHWKIRSCLNQRSLTYYPESHQWANPYQENDMILVGVSGYIIIQNLN